MVRWRACARAPRRAAVLMATCSACNAPLCARRAVAHSRVCARLRAQHAHLTEPSPPPSPSPSPPPSPSLSAPHELQSFLARHLLTQHARALTAAGVHSLWQLRALSAAQLDALALPVGARRRLLHALAPARASKRARDSASQRDGAPAPAPAPRAKRARSGNKLTPPFAHRVHGTDFVVDAFRFELGDDAVTFLTHYHSDHYMGLPRSLRKRATLYCTRVTGALVKRLLRVPGANVKCLDFDKRYGVQDSAGKRALVWLFDANHCPGAALILFFVVHTKRWVLHTGDFRYSAAHFNRFSMLVELVQCASLHYVHLDTTYCSPSYAFPPQQVVLDTALEHARKEDKRTKGACIFFFGTYSIGKEKVFLHVAAQLKLHIYACKRKRETLLLLDIPELSSRLVDDPKRARVHVVAMNELKPESLRKYVKSNRLSHRFIGRALAICFRPTGWTYNGGAVRRELRAADNAVVFQLPYSEHSSFDELRQFVSWAKPCRLIPMVGAHTAQKRQHMKEMLAHEDGALSQPALIPALCGF
eukprot:TRINITY_DN376_c1_g3_i1.p1 TRINITY_DN376_c1_g3~~TRINITY_DN376_c1_g3_i1.p1  ORF type:complete len:532 (-),score=130.78 TRINITY_DN376_c1_g3_i1:969-2564(-)